MGRFHHHHHHHHGRHHHHRHHHHGGPGIVGALVEGAVIGAAINSVTRPARPPPTRVIVQQPTTTVVTTTPANMGANVVVQQQQVVTTPPQVIRQDVPINQTCVVNTTLIQRRFSKGSVVWYTIEVFPLDGSLPWAMNRRYSQFFHLSAELNRLGIGRLRPLPPKSMFGLNNVDLAQRQAGLAAWLSEAIERSKALNRPAVNFAINRFLNSAANYRPHTRPRPELQQQQVQVNVQQQQNQQAPAQPQQQQFQPQQQQFQPQQQQFQQQNMQPQQQVQQQVQQQAYQPVAQQQNQSSMPVASAQPVSTIEKSAVPPELQPVPMASAPAMGGNNEMSSSSVMSPAVENELRNLKYLFDQKLISQAEYDEKKRNVLNI